MLQCTGEKLLLAYASIFIMTFIWTSYTRFINFLQVSHLLNMEDQLVENMEIDEDTCNYSSEEDDEVNELIREIFGDEESLEEEHEEEYEDGNEMWNETRENYEDEYSLLRERRFVVGEGALLSLIKRTTCEQCGESIDRPVNSC